jgi:hypothetical protein
LHNSIAVFLSFLFLSFSFLLSHWRIYERNGALKVYCFVSSSCAPKWSWFFKERLGLEYNRSHPLTHSQVASPFIVIAFSRSRDQETFLGLDVQMSSYAGTAAGLSISHV